MTEVAENINKPFGRLPESDFVQPSDEEPLFVTPSQLRDLISKAIAEAIQPLKDEVESLKAEIQHLKDTQPGVTASRVDDAFEAISDIDEHLARIDHTRTTAPPQGSKTIARIAKVDEVLKARGSTTLKELERILKISPREMSRLVEKLDKRRFELHSRPGDNRERVLRLKVQIR